MSFQSSIIQESEQITQKSSPLIQFQPKTPFLKPCESPEFEIDDFALPEAIDDFEEEQIEDYMDELKLENQKSSEPSIETSLHFKEKKENRR